jgi:hypothetical protein
MYGEACGSAPRTQRISVSFSGRGRRRTLYIRSFKRTGGDAAITIRNNRGMLGKVEESFLRCLHYCIDNNGGHFE